MRLLKIADDGSLSFTHDLSDDRIPRYAIFSHTWGPPEDEVLYQDIHDGAALSKEGFRKIKYCAAQATRDGLEHIWVDTCCINKHNLVELSEAINSMFKWYARSQVCYVWLPDVTAKAVDHDGDADERLNTSLRSSRWFTRGWTLQELIAPKKVIFYSYEWTTIGDKSSLEALLSEITRVPGLALRGEPMEHFSITERLSWQDVRQTTKEEDKAYALFGICGVNLPLIYSEGRNNAFRRLRNEIESISKGIERESFALPFAVDDVIGVEHFVARQDELRDMRQNLSSDGSRRTVVIHGLGGIGKTQSMIAYAKRHKDDYSAIFWLNAKDNDSLKGSFAKIARHIQQFCPSTKSLADLDSASPNLDYVVNAVQMWLCQPGNTRWLMLFDNLDNPKLPGNTDPAAVDIRKYLPSVQQGFVAITTRSSRLDIGYQLHLQKFDDPKHSLEVLADTSKRDISIDTPSAIELTERLDGLPLALASAGAYLRQSSMDLAEYLHWHDIAWEKLQHSSPGLFSYDDRMLYSTWQVSLDQADRINPLSAKLLHLWAYFDNQDIWHGLLSHEGSLMGQRPDWIIDVVKDALTFEEAIRVLRDHGLVEPHSTAIVYSESAGYSIHSCVHSWTRTVLNADRNTTLATFALKCIALQRKRGDGFKLWLTEGRLLRHASWVLDDHRDKPFGESAWAFVDIGGIYLNAGKLAEAESLYDKAWNEVQDIETYAVYKFSIAHHLGVVCSIRGDYSKAETMLCTAMHGYGKFYGERNAWPLRSMSALAHMLHRMGQLTGAKEMHSIALKALESMDEPDVDLSLATIKGLGDVCTELGELDEAERLLQRSVRQHEDVYGLDHATTFEAMADLANLHRAKGDLSLAEDLMSQAIRGQERTLGPDHRKTLVLRNDLGRILRISKKWDECEKVLLRVLRGYERLYGRNDALTLEFPVHELALLFEDQSKALDAEQMYLRGVRGLERALGSQHRATAKVMHNLSVMYSRQGRFDDAKDLLVTAVRGFQAAYGDHHADTLRYPVTTIGWLFEMQSNFPKAEEFYLRALRGLERVSGSYPKEIAQLWNNLGHLSYVQGKFKEAEEMLPQAVERFNAAYGPDHVETLRLPVINLATLFAKQGRVEEAEQLYGCAVTAREHMRADCRARLDQLAESISELRKEQVSRASLAMLPVTMEPDETDEVPKETTNKERTTVHEENTKETQVEHPASEAGPPRLRKKQKASKQGMLYPKRRGASARKARSSAP